MPILYLHLFSIQDQIIVDIPASERFDVLKALITNSDSSSMVKPLVQFWWYIYVRYLFNLDLNLHINVAFHHYEQIAILLDIVKGELHTEGCHRNARENGETILTQNTANPHTLFWSANVLELVEMVLQPQKGGPPSLPEQGDAVFVNPLAHLIEFNLTCLIFCSSFNIMIIVLPSFESFNLVWYLFSAIYIVLITKSQRVVL